MILDLDELYQQVILDHSRQPRNRGELPDATRSAEGYNPLCGDRITVRLRERDGRIEDARFTGQGCAICTASASMMTDSIKGRTVAEAEKLFECFHDLLTGAAPDPVCQMGKLAAFADVRKFPIRVKCAALPWHTMRAAVKEQPDVVTTE